MGYWGWKPYVPVATRRAQAQQAIRKASKAGKGFAPVTLTSRTIAKTFWGRAWCDNLKAYSDFANRLPRGGSYVRNGFVVDLNIEAGKVIAQVLGSSLYRIEIGITRLPARRWKQLVDDCTGSIDTLVELLQGKFSNAVMARICEPSTGLFPSNREIEMACSCPDWAVMCKHVAAVLYGVGARLDERPELLFVLRQVDPNDLLSAEAVALPASAGKPAPKKVLDDAEVADVFGIEMAAADGLAPKAPATRRTPGSTKTRKRAGAKSGSKQRVTRAKPSARKTAKRQTTVKRSSPTKRTRGAAKVGPPRRQS